MILLTLAAVATLLTSAPLADKDGDGKVTITKALGPFKKGGTLTLCKGQPSFTYAVVCPPPPAPPAAQLGAFVGAHLWHNSYPDAPINGKVIEGVKATCKETCIWFGRATTDGIIRDMELTRSAPSKASAIDAGIKVGGSKGGVATTGLLIERVNSHGWLQNTTPGKYANGDGLVINRGVGTVTVRQSTFDNNADGGVDTKADLTILDNVSASDNGHYGFRFWNPVKATTLTCDGNKWGCIEAEAGARVTIDKLVMIGGEELVTTKKGAEVTILACDLSKYTGTVATKGPGKVTLGVGCK